MFAPATSSSTPSFLRMIEDRIRITTSNRVRGLAVEFTGGQVVLRGQVPTRHAKQLVLHAALEFVSGDELSEQIQVG